MAFLGSAGYDEKVVCPDGMVDFFAIKVEAGALCSPLLNHGGKGVVNDVVEFGGGSVPP